MMHNNSELKTDEGMERLFETPNYTNEMSLANGHNNTANSFKFESSFVVGSAASVTSQSSSHEQIDPNNNHEQSSTTSSAPDSPKKMTDRLPLNSPAVSYAQASGLSQNEPKATLDYLNQLFEDKKKLQMLKLPFYHLDRLIDAEIQRVRTSLIHIDGGAEDRKPLELPEPEGEIVQRSIKIFLPVDKYPDFNFAGRLIGPRGLTIRELESVCQCKFYIRGKGSMRNKSREEQLRDQPSYEHLHEEQHVRAIAEDTENRAQIKLARAKQEIEKIIDSVINNKDDFKKRQLAELAILNDKYKIKDSQNSILPVVPSAPPGAVGLPLLDPTSVQLLPSPASVTGVPITPFDSLFASQVQLPVPQPPPATVPTSAASAAAAAAAFAGLDPSHFFQLPPGLLPVMPDPKILSAMVSQAGGAAAAQFSPALASIYSPQLKTGQAQRFHPYRKQ